MKRAGSEEPDWVGNVDPILDGTCAEAGIAVLTRPQSMGMLSGREDLLGVVLIMAKSVRRRAPLSPVGRR